MNELEKETTGISWVLENDVSTDDIIPGQFLEIRDFDELSCHVFHPLDINFKAKVKPGDIIIAGENFGCGSSREQAPALLKHLGIRTICAKSFARIFFRNAINIGLPLFEIDNATYNVFSQGDLIRCTISPPRIINETKEKTIILKLFPRFFMNILEHGGAIPLLKEKLGNNGK